MTLLEVEELTHYWSEHPPVHLLLAAFMSAGGTIAPMAGSGGGDFIRPHQPRLSEILTLPGVGQTIRPLTARFGPGAVDEMRAMLRRFKASTMARNRCRPNENGDPPE